MQRDEALSTLQIHKDEIMRRFGVKHLALFGSTVRNEAREDSDLDILVDFGGPATSDQYFNLLFFLEDTFGCEVDLVTERALRRELRPYVESEAIHVA